MARPLDIPIVRLLAVALPSLTLATVAVGLLQDVVGVPNPSAVYIVAVVATAVISGTPGAIVAAVASFLLYDFLYTEPRYTFTIDEPAIWVAALILLFVGIVVGHLAALQRSRAEIARAREREARALFQLSLALATRESTPAALAGIVAILVEHTGMRRIWIGLGDDVATEQIVADSEAGPRPGRSTQLRVLRRMPGDTPAQWIRIHEPAAKPRHGSTETGRDGDVYRVRIEASGEPLGSIWAIRDRGDSVPGRSETRLLAAAADQVGQAIGRDRMIAEQQAAEIARQGDAVKSALLQSVSHDLRTPLATIRAAAGSLRPGSGLTSEDQRESAEAIDREVEYLNRLVTNLLDLSRIEAGALKADRDVFELDDIVGQSLQRLRGRLGDRRVEVELSDRAIEVDPVFLDEALTNIVENTLKYTPADAPLRISDADGPGGRVRLTIEDGGPGVPEQALGRLFDKFYRVPEARRKSRAGTGIGLAVVRGLVEAMGGAVQARRSPLGGLAIDIDLPAADVPDLAASA